MTKIDVVDGVVINKTGYITIIENGEPVREFGTPREGWFVKYWVHRSDGANLKQLFNGGGMAVYWPSSDVEECARYIAKRNRMKFYGHEAK